MTERMEEARQAQDKMNPTTGENNSILLSFDVLREVFLRIPAEDLVRLKRVCKAWAELIGSRHFAESHAERWISCDDASIGKVVLDIHFFPKLSLDSRNDVFYLPEEEDGELTQKKEEEEGGPRLRRIHVNQNNDELEKYDGKKFRLVASCDGLILICYDGLDCSHPTICNPLTGSCTTLPVFRPMRFSPWIFNNSEYFDWVMVRAPSVGRYKIFAMAKEPTSHLFSIRGCFVLSVGSGESARKWKPLPGLPHLPQNWLVVASIAKEGNVQWLGTVKNPRNEGSFFEHQEITIVSIDVLTEEFGAPSPVMPSSMPSRYFGSRGEFYCWRKDYRDHSASLLVLEDSDTMKWRSCMRFHYCSCYFPGVWDVRFDFALLGKSKLVMLDCSGCTYVMDLISNKCTKVAISDLDVRRGIRVVHHTHSLL